MQRVHTKASTPVFTGLFHQSVSHVCSTKLSTLNFSKLKLKLAKTRYRTSIRGLTICNDFNEHYLKKNEKTPFFKVKMKP